MPMSTVEDTIKLAKNGQPFKGEEQAQQELKKLELPVDVWGVFPHDGGFAIRQFAAVFAESKVTAKALDDASRAKAAADERYFFVEFPPRSSPQDSEKVEVSWQGIRITVSREVKVALPEKYLGVCDNAVQKVFEPADRGTAAYRSTGVVRRRPYMKHGPATREDFLTQWNEGNAITRRTVVAAGGRPHDASQAPV
jgi:hypothetical protein